MEHFCEQLIARKNTAKIIRVKIATIPKNQRVSLGLMVKAMMIDPKTMIGALKKRRKNWLIPT